MSNGRYPSPNSAYQAVHSLIGYSVLVTSHVFRLPLGWTVLVIVVGSAAKEFGYDCYGPEKDSWFSSAEDFAFYMLGMFVGIGIVVLRHVL